MTRVLTHKLKLVAGRWSCRCGYILGSGHEKLYATCPMTTCKLPVKTKAIVELFDMARGPRPKPKRKKK